MTQSMRLMLVHEIGGGPRSPEVAPEALVRARLATSEMTASDIPDADERWTLWVAKGAAHRRMVVRMRYLAAVVVGGWLAWLAFTIATR
jgi:hypothetical protein